MCSAQGCTLHSPTVEGSKTSGGYPLQALGGAARGLVASGNSCCAPIRLRGLQQSGPGKGVSRTGFDGLGLIRRLSGVACAWRVQSGFLELSASLCGFDLAPSAAARPGHSCLPGAWWGGFRKGGPYSFPGSRSGHLATEAQCAWGPGSSLSGAAPVPPNAVRVGCSSFSVIVGSPTNPLYTTPRNSLHN